MSTTSETAKQAITNLVDQRKLQLRPACVQSSQQNECSHDNSDIEGNWYL